MVQNGPPPRIGSDTLRQRAAQSGAIWEAKQRVRQDVADEFEAVSADEVPVQQHGGGIGPPDAFYDYAAPREAAFQLDSEFPRQDLSFQDVEPTDGGGGFRAAEPVRRRAAAFEYEAETQLGDVDPMEDLAPGDDGGFGLTSHAEQTLAARQFEDALDVFGGGELAASDVERTDDGFGLVSDRRLELGAERLDEQYPERDIGVDDVELRDGSAVYRR